MTWLLRPIIERVNFSIDPCSMIGQIASSLLIFGFLDFPPVGPMPMLLHRSCPVDKLLVVVCVPPTVVRAFCDVPHGFVVAYDSH